jgi:hypothetical protein
MVDTHAQNIEDGLISPRAISSKDRALEFVSMDVAPETPCAAPHLRSGANPPGLGDDLLRACRQAVSDSGSDIINVIKIGECAIQQLRG